MEAVNPHHTEEETLDFPPPATPASSGSAVMQIDQLRPAFDDRDREAVRPHAQGFVERPAERALTAGARTGAIWPEDLRESEARPALKHDPKSDYSPVATVQCGAAPDISPECPRNDTTPCKTGGCHHLSSTVFSESDGARTRNHRIDSPVL